MSTFIQWLRFAALLVGYASWSAQVSGAMGDHLSATVERPRLALGEELVLSASGISDYLTMHPKATFVLFINGRPVAKAARQGVAKDQVAFDLRWIDREDKNWPAIVGKPTLSLRPVSLQIGVDGELPLPATLNADFVTVDHWKLSACLIFLALLVCAFVVLAIRSDLLRDPTPVPAGMRPPYSLARTQMAVWFVLIVSAFIFIFAVTDTYYPLNDGVLLLAGITTATALGAAVIDSGKDAAGGGSTKERFKYQLEVAKKLSANPTDANLKTQLNDLIARDGIPPTSRNFTHDLLSDENGVSFHRFQIMVWTIVLAGIFVWIVYATLAMPDFDARLLTLLGISSGTYLGFKFPERA